MISRTIKHIEELNKLVRLKTFFRNLEKFGVFGNPNETTYRAFKAVAIEKVKTRDENKLKKMYDEMMTDKESAISFFKLH